LILSNSGHLIMDHIKRWKMFGIKKKAYKLAYEDILELFELWSCQHKNSERTLSVQSSHVWPVDPLQSRSQDFLGQICEIFKKNFFKYTQSLCCLTFVRSTLVSHWETIYVQHKFRWKKYTVLSLVRQVKKAVVLVAL
jgi:hypothetical protein